MSILTTSLETWNPPTDHPGALWEFVNGEWKETPRMGLLASLLASELVGYLGAFARENK